MASLSSLSIEELITRCYLQGEIAAWEEFVQRFHRLIASMVIRAANRMGDASKQTVDDLIQETYLRFCADNYKVLRTFEHRHPQAFLGFVKVVASNVVRDHFKSTYSEKHGANRIDALEEDFTPAAAESTYGSSRALERNVLIEEIERHLTLCVAGEDQERSRKVFWLYYRVGLSAGAIAALPEISLTTKGVESLILRLTRELRARITIPNVHSRERNTALAKGILPAQSL